MAANPPRNPLIHGPELPLEQINPEADEITAKAELQAGITRPQVASSEGSEPFLRNAALQADADQEIVVDLDKIDSASVSLTYSSPRAQARRRKILFIRDANAAEALADFDQETDVVGLMTGRFGLIHLLRHLFTITGPGNLTVSSWRLYAKDVDHVLKTLAAGRLLSARWLLDSTFQHRQPLEANQIREKFGRSALRVTRNHAKFLLLGTPDRRWTITIKTSANLNQNPRLEHFDITNDPNLFDFLNQIVDGIFSQDDFSRIARFPRPLFFQQMANIQVDADGKRGSDP